MYLSQAKENCNGLELDGRRIRVDFSITKRAHTPTPGVYMGRPTRPRDDEHVDRDDRYDDRSYERSGYDREYGERGSGSGSGLYLGNGEVGSILEKGRWALFGKGVVGSIRVKSCLYLEPGECGK